MFRFAPNDLVVSLTLIAAGLTCLYLLFSLDWDSPKLRRSPPEVLWFVGGAMIGAGIFTPYQRPGLGVIVGVLVNGLIYVGVQMLLY